MEWMGGILIAALTFLLPSVFLLATMLIQKILPSGRTLIR